MALRQKYCVFIASPADVADEREQVSLCVKRVNAELDKGEGPEFELIGWESMSGTAQRPQEAINDLIDRCDYMVCIFKRDWGSAPGGPLGYTSGTEEELFTALLGLGRESHPMRDVWIAFVDTEECSSQVEALKTQIRERNALLYESVQDLGDLYSKLSRRLMGWARATGKEPRNVNLIPRSGRNVLAADRMRRRGEKLVELGDVEQGVAALDESIQLGGPPELLAYARVLARLGRIDKAGELADEAIMALSDQSADLRAPSVAEAHAFRAYLMRREGQVFEAKQRLKQALSLLHGKDVYTTKVRCRILDDLGLACHKLQEYPEACKHFREALKARTPVGELSEIAQSEVNLARTFVKQGDFESAFECSQNALARLEVLPPSALYANACLLRAQILVRTNDPQEAVRFAEMARSLNNQLSNRIGEARALNVLAQAHGRLGEADKSSEYAQRSLELNDEMHVSTPPPVLEVLAHRGNRSMPEGKPENPSDME